MGEDEGNYKKAITHLQSRKSRNTAKTWLNKKEEFNYIKSSMSIGSTTLSKMTYKVTDFTIV